MSKLTYDIREKILADWKAGITQNQLAKKYSVSPATINKICKGVEQTNINLVNAKVAVITAMQGKSEYEVNSIESEVNNKVKHTMLINSNAELIASKIPAMLNDIDSVSDLKLLAETNDRIAITLKVADRHAPKQDINLTNAVQNNVTPNEITSAIAEALPN